MLDDSYIHVKTFGPASPTKGLRNASRRWIGSAIRISHHSEPLNSSEKFIYKKHLKESRAIRSTLRPKS